MIGKTIFQGSHKGPSGKSWKTQCSFYSGL